MNLPSFDEFYESLEGERMESIMAQCVCPEQLAFNPLTNEGMNIYTGTVLRMSMRISIKLMEYYHDWLSEQLFS